MGGSYHLFIATVVHSRSPGSKLMRNIEQLPLGVSIPRRDLVKSSEQHTHFLLSLCAEMAIYSPVA